MSDAQIVQAYSDRALTGIIRDLSKNRSRDMQDRLQAAIRESYLRRKLARIEDEIALSDSL